MSESVPQSGPARDALRRLKVSLASAAGLDEMVVALQTALSALRPRDQVSRTGLGAGLVNPHTFASVPQWPAHRWVTTPVKRSSQPSNPSPPGEAEGRRPVRTGELSLGGPTGSGEDEDADHADNITAADDGSLDMRFADSEPAEPTEVEDRSVLMAETDLGVDHVAEPTHQATPVAPHQVTSPNAPRSTSVDEAGAQSTGEQPDASERPRGRWRGSSQLMALLLGNEDLGTLLRAALKLSIQSFRVNGALIHLRDEYGSLTERVFALGEPAFEATLRATARQGSRPRNLTDNAASGDTLSVRYPHRLIVPIAAAGDVLGEFYLFRSALRPYSREETEDAHSFATTLAVALEQTRLRQQQLRQHEILATVHKLAERLNSTATPAATAEIGVEICAGAFGSGMATLHLYQEQSKRLVMAAAFGLPVPFVTGNAHLALGVGACGLAAQGKALVVVEDVMADPDWMSIWHVSDDSFKLGSVWALPLIGSDNYLLGTLAIYHQRAGKESEDDITLLRLIGHQIATALDRARLVGRSQDLYRATVESLAAAVDAKDPFTHNHSWQVAAYCRKIAEALGLTGGEVEIIELAGLLHDVGKIGIPDRVLQKPDELSPDEWTMMERHPDLGARILGDNPALAPVVPYVRHHHERYDGRGYPDRLSGNDIPLGAAIVGLADAFDTMTSDRPYRRARTMEQALEEVARCSGSHFHPKVASTFLEVIRAGEIGPATLNTPKVTTRELTLKRDLGSEARAFSLLQRITTEIGGVLEVERFLHRLNELISVEFSASACEIYRQDPTSGDLASMANSRRRESAIVIPRGLGIIGWIADHGVAQNVPDVLEDPRFRISSQRSLRSLLAVPLVVDGHCAGVLSLENQDVGAFSHADQHVLEIVATYVAQAIQVADLHDRLKRHSEHDPLTGLLNHRGFCRRLDEEIERASETDGKLAVAILDIHDLKALNRMNGHAYGDEALKRVADVLKLKVRGGDTVARYGGDEFALLVPRVNAPLIRGRVGLIVDALAEERARSPIPTITWGVACFPTDGSNAAEIVAAAEVAMRAASNTV